MMNNPLFHFSDSDESSKEIGEPVKMLHNPLFHFSDSDESSLEIGEPVKEDQEYLFNDHVIQNEGSVPSTVQD